MLVGKSSVPTASRLRRLLSSRRRQRRLQPLLRKRMRPEQHPWRPKTPSKRRNKPPAMTLMCTPHPSGNLPRRDSEPPVLTSARRLARCLGGDTSAALSRPRVLYLGLLSWRCQGPTDPSRRHAT
eukprot:5468114-Amphidinium_carterae.1